MPPSYFDASGTSNAMFDELAERPLMSPLAGMKHTYVRLAIVIFSHFKAVIKGAFSKSYGCYGNLLGYEKDNNVFTNSRAVF